MNLLSPVKSLLDEIFETFKGQRFILDIHENNPTLIRN